MNHFKALNKKIFLVYRLKSLFLQVWLSTAETQRQSGTSTPTRLKSRCSKLFLTYRTKEATLWQVIEGWPNQFEILLFQKRDSSMQEYVECWPGYSAPSFPLAMTVLIIRGGEALVPRRSNWVFVSDAQEWLLTTSSRTTSEPTLGCVQRPAKSESW